MALDYGIILFIFVGICTGINLVPRTKRSTCPHVEDTIKLLQNYPGLAEKFKSLFQDKSLSMDDPLPPRFRITSSCLLWSKPSMNFKNATGCDQFTDHQGYKQSQVSYTSCSYCCETIWNTVVPLTVTYGSDTYKVYHPDEGWQVVLEGVCKAGVDCVDGSCVENNSWYTWILVEDENVGEDPKVKFVPITYPQYCFCQYRS